MPMPKLSLHMGHGPVVFSRPTSAAIPAPTTTPTTAKRGTDPSLEAPSRQIWYTDESGPERIFSLHTVRTIYAFRYFEEGVHIDSLYDTDCHALGHYVYFTITYANGTLALDPEGRPGLFHFGTKWYLTYPKVLRKAIFNDAMFDSADPQCKNGHCFSEVLPGVQYRNESIRLKRADPELLRTDWSTVMCDYDDKVPTIKKSSVNLGSIGYYVRGANIPPAVIDFVEERVRTTYPTLEIALFVWLTVGLIPTLLILPVLICTMMELAYERDTVLPKILALIKRGHSFIWVVIITAPYKLCGVLKRELIRTGKVLKESKNDQPKTAAQQKTDRPSTSHEEPPAYENSILSELSSMFELPDWPVLPPKYHAHHSDRDLNV
ncbi:hypothetical protein ACET3X_006268 [Alternaria dauci]|uniref:Uncharacterized protein n=1 Tax=Alternaria dauci TaxID=48095 RepID=A0ABR3UI64_9PLEO